MAMSRGERRVLVAGALLAALVPVVALFPYGVRGTVAAEQRAAAIVPAPLPVAVRLFDRPLFAPAEGVGDVAAGDAPVLTGIAGRLNRDAVALVRLADGSARTLAIGESVDGWRLESLAIDAAYFTRGRERARVAMAQDAAEGDAPVDNGAR